MSKKDDVIGDAVVGIVGLPFDIFDMVFFDKKPSLEEREVAALEQIAENGKKK